MKEQPRFFEQEAVSEPGDETLGKRIVHAREEQELTTSQLARRLGVLTETLQSWESNQDGPRPNVLVRLAGLLNVSPTWLLTGKGESPPDVMPQTEMMHIQATIERLHAVALALADELAQLKERLDSYQSHHS